MHIDISVIIPMYNTGKFIKECISSIASQNLNVEIIVIDDGSEKNSYQIANDLALKDRRIVLLQTKNCGPGNARNLGLSIAKGKCITFIDSDDWIIKNSLDIMYKELADNDLDMVMGNALFYYHSKDIRQRYKTPPSLFGKVMQGKECYINLSNANSFIPMVYCYMYKHEFLKRNNIRFQKEMYEDELWTIQTVCQAEKIKIMDFPFYYYRQRNGSIMHGAETIYKKSSSLIALSKNILSFSRNASFTNDDILKSWLYVRAIQMYYYALTKLHEKEDFIAFYYENVDYLSDVVKNKKNISGRITNDLFLYYIERIIKITSNNGVEIPLIN